MSGLAGRPSPGAPAFGIRGVVEGFHGRPWTPRDRREVITFLKQRGFNEYVYAPKDDPYLRARWREPYPKVDLIVFDDALSYTRHGDLRFVFGLWPGADITYSDPDERAAIWRKWDVLWERGVRRFLLAFDDADGEQRPADREAFGEGEEGVGRAQGELVARLFAEGRSRDPQFRLYVRPARAHGLEATPYRATLARVVPPEVTIIWTGPRARSAVISVEEARAAARVLGRPPVLWDPYPANDFRRERLFLGPVRGRDPRLGEAVAGVWAQPMVEAASSEIALHTWSLYLDDPAAYDPDRALEDAARHIGGRHAGDALLEFARLNQSSDLWPGGEAPELRRALDDVAGIWRGDGSPREEEWGCAVRRLAGVLEAIASIPGRLDEHLPRRDLMGELRPWLERLAGEAALAGEALAVLARESGLGDLEPHAAGSLTAGRPPREAAALLWEGLSALPPGRVVAEGMMAAFVQRVAGWLESRSWPRSQPRS